MITATRYHDFSCGHRVAGHENKCASLHGHNYRIHFTIGASELDHLGRVADFGAEFKVLCNWLEKWWDHKMLLWEKDPWIERFFNEDATEMGILLVPFNPTAENMAKYLGEVIAPGFLESKGLRCTRVIVEETRKCSAEWRMA